MFRKLNRMYYSQGRQVDIIGIKSEVIFSVVGDYDSNYVIEVAVEVDNEQVTQKIKQSYHELIPSQMAEHVNRYAPVTGPIIDLNKRYFSVPVDDCKLEYFDVYEKKELE